ncbi:E3 ubiquitin-protein ligase RNF31-like isoform X1 [Sphaeramia orbicularis]|nr:E3 ubiquitin-protein ligase RNF31-like isoform X1 [Sphaeramia orbicularis]
MVINPACPCVDASGNVQLDALSSWTQGTSSLSLLVSEMRRAFQRDTPLYARRPLQTPPPIGVCVSSGSPFHSTPDRQHLSRHQAIQWEQSREGEARRSYAEELQGIDFSVPSNNYNPFLSPAPSGASPPDILSRTMDGLKLDAGPESGRDQQVGSPARITQSETARRQNRTHSVPLVPGPEPPQCIQVEPKSDPEADHIKIASCLPPDKAAIFLRLLDMEGPRFSTTDVLEAVHLNRDYPSALKFLTYSCPICQEQVSFSKVITMTHCSCFLCQTCFKTFFSVAIKEKSIDQLVCPQCGRPRIQGHGGMEEAMDYFNLLDTQIRHFLPPQLHELFQRKLRDRALQEMTNFCWCAHCSFGMLHEVDRLRMDCPSCKKSTCSQCRSPWSIHHEGLSCDQFKLWQQQNQPENVQTNTDLSSSSIECPSCQLVFSLSRGGCLHFTCSQCKHQFCGGCSQPFTPGPACSFGSTCASKGLHAHHPRDCLYHLRDWSVTRLHLLLQYYRVSPSWLKPANSSAVDSGLKATGECSVLEFRDSSRKEEEPCGRPAPPTFRGYCQIHYKERLVELINRCRADPVMLFSTEEMVVELQRWNVTVPMRRPDESEPKYTDRLRMVVTDAVPLRKQPHSLFNFGNSSCPLTPAVAAPAPPPHLLLRD